MFKQISKYIAKFF